MTIDHIGIYVADFEKSKAFYQERSRRLDITAIMAASGQRN